MVGFIFGGDTGMTPERLARERALAEAMLARGMSGGSQTGWEGLGRLAHAVAGRFKEGRVAEKEAEGRRRGSEAFREALAALSGAGMAAPPVAAPAASPGFDLESLAVGGAAARPDSFDGMDPTFRGNLEAFIAAAPEDLRSHLKITSGFRSPETQAQLWEEALAKYGSEAEARKWVAPPGKSQHNHGRAVDFAFGSPEAQAWAHENAAQFGLDFPMEWEPWQAELAGARGGFDPARVQAAIDQSDPTLRRVDVQPSPIGAPGGVQPGGNVVEALMTALGNEWLSDNQRSILEQALAERLQGPETMTPYQAAQLDLAERRLAAQMAGKGGFAAPVTNVNVPGQQPARMGTIPPGFAVYGDGTPENPFRMEAIAGGPKDTSAATAAANEQAARAGNIVIEDIGRLRAKIESAPWYSPVTGMAGDALGMVPGTNAFDARALQRTIAANIGFDRLQQMREASPTGGALGSVTERELDTLQAVLGNISLSQSEAQLLENLDRLDRIYRDILRKAAAYPNAADFGFVAPPPQRPDGVSEAEWNAMTDDEKALFQ